MTILEKLTLVGRVEDRVGELNLGLDVIAILGGTACEVKNESNVIAVILNRDADVGTLLLVRSTYNISCVPIISEDDPGMMNQIRYALS